MLADEVGRIKKIFEGVSRSSGVYRRRIMSVDEAYLTPHEQFCKCVDRASLENWLRCSASSAS